MQPQVVRMNPDALNQLEVLSLAERNPLEEQISDVFNIVLIVEAR